MYTIPLTSRLRGPYGKLRTKFFFLPAQARSALAMKIREKTGIHNLPYRTIKMFIIWLC